MNLVFSPAFNAGVAATTAVFAAVFGQPIFVAIMSVLLAVHAYRFYVADSE